MAEYVEYQNTEEAQSQSEAPRRGPIGVHINLDLWKQFRIQAYRQDTTATLLLENLMREYLNREELE